MATSDERVKILLELVVKNQEELKKVRAEFSALKASLQQTSKTSQNIANAFQNVSQNLQHVKKQTESVHSAFRGLVWTIVRAEIVVRGLLRIVDLLGDAFRSSLQSVDEFKQSIIGLAAIKTTLASAIVPKQDLAQYYQRAKQEAEGLYKQLLVLSAQTPVTTQQLFRLVTLFQAYGQEVNLNLEAHRAGLLALANAIYTVTQGQRLELQLLQESRALFGQSNKQSATLLQILKAIYPEIEKQLKAWREEGTLLEHLAEILYPFTYAAKDLQNTWTGVSQALKSTFQIIKKEAFGDWYKEVVSGLQSLVNALYNLKTGEIQPLGKAVIYSFKAAADNLLMLRDAFKSLLPSAEKAAGILKGLALITKFLSSGFYLIAQAVRVDIQGLKLLGNVITLVWKRIKGEITDLPAALKQAGEKFNQEMEKVGKDIEKFHRKYFPELFDQNQQEKSTYFNPLIQVFEKVDKLRASLLNNPIKIQTTLDINSLDTQIATVQDRLLILKRAQQEIVKGLTEKGPYTPWEIYGDKWRQFFNASKLRDWADLLEEYSKRGDEQAKKILQQIKLIDAQRKIEEKHLYTLNKLKDIAYQKEALKTQLLKTQDPIMKEIIQKELQILNIKKEIVTSTDPKLIQQYLERKKILTEEIELLRQQATILKAAEAESKAIIQRRKAEKEIYEELSKLYNKLSTKQISPLQKWLYGDVYEVAKIKGEITQLYDKALKSGIDISDQIKQLESLADQLTNPWVKFKNKVEEIFVDLFSNLHNMFVNWLTTLHFDLKDVVKLFRRTIAEIVVSWAGTLAKSIFIGAPFGGKAPGQSTSSTFNAPGLSTLLTQGVSGLRNFFMAPARVAGMAVGELPYGPWTNQFAKIATFLSNNPWLSAGLMAAASTLLFTGNVKSAALGGLASGLGFAFGGPAGGLLGGLAGSVLGSLFGGKKKAPRVTFDAEVEVGFVPGQGLTITDLSLDTRRKYGAKADYERQVRDAISNYINAPVKSLSSALEDVLSSVPEDVRWRLDKAASDIIVKAELSQRTHKSLKGDIDARPFESFAVDLIRSYRDVFEKAFKEEIKAGEALLTKVSPYLREDVKNWFLDQVQALFPKDIFNHLKDIPIEKIKGADFNKWLEENIKPLFDDISAWEKFYDWATNYLKTVQDIVDQITNGLNVLSSFGQQVYDVAKQSIEYFQKVTSLGLKYSLAFTGAVEHAQLQMRLQLASQFSDIYKAGPIYLESALRQISSALSYLGINADQIRDLVNQGIYKPFTDILWNLKDNLSWLQQVSDSTGIPLQNLIGAIGTLGDVAAQNAENLNRLADQALQAIFGAKGDNYNKFALRQRLQQLEQKYGVSDSYIAQLSNLYYRYRMGDQFAAKQVAELIKGWDEQTINDALEAITLYNNLLSEENRTRERVTSTIQRQATAHKRLSEAYDSVFNRIESFLNEVQFGQYNVARPTVKLEELAAKLTPLFSSALTDKKYIEDFLQLSKQYLQISQELYKSSTAYQQNYQFILDMVKQLEAHYGQLAGIPGFQFGDILTEPRQRTLLHETETVIPLKDSAVPIQGWGSGVSKDELKQAFKEALIEAAKERPINIHIQVGNEDFDAYILQLVDQYRAESSKRQITNTEVRF